MDKELKNIATSVKEKLRNISAQSFIQPVFDSKWNPDKWKWKWK